MFTGITEEKGKIQTIRNNFVIIECLMILDKCKIGDSIAVNGVCLTVTEIGKSFFKADISPETFNVTALKYLKTGDSVNLERAMPANGRFGGHIVSGHIDGTARVINILKNNDFYDIEIELNPSESRYVIRKGSVTINGISLTVASIEGERIKIALIPHTYENTNLSNLKIGDYVNIEVDIVAKYIEKFLSTRDNKSGVNMDFLERNGFC